MIPPGNMESSETCWLTRQITYLYWGISEVSTIPGEIELMHLPPVRTGNGGRTGKHSICHSVWFKNKTPSLKQYLLMSNALSM